MKALNLFRVRDTSSRKGDWINENLELPTDSSSAWSEIRFNTIQQNKNFWRIPTGVNSSHLDLILTMS